MTKVKNLGKRINYHKEIDNNKTNPKNMWNILCISLPNNKKNISTEIPKLILNEVEVFQNNKICHYFNKHFATVGINLAYQIKSDKNKFKSFLSNRVFSSAAFVSLT